MRKIAAGLSILVAALLAGPAVAAERSKPAPTLDKDPRVRALTADRLTLFRNDAELRRYLRQVEAIDRARFAGVPRPNQFAQATPPPCIPPEECPVADEEASEGAIVVTGARASSNPSITNNQKAGVEEGDIVKQIGQYLLVLQDGRIFVVDTKAGGGSDLAVADRVNVYRSTDQDTWYDEMLVHGDRVLITGYSYDEGATELAVFRLGPRGKLAHEGTFYLSSNDYYDSNNYATRISGGRLIVYTPLRLDADDERFEWPVIRRWMPGLSRAEAVKRGTRLLDARSIYRPVQPTLAPVVHTVSVCPLGRSRAGADLRCRTTGFVGPGRREWYVSPTDAYFWVTPSWSELDALQEAGTKCPHGRRPDAAGTVPAMLFRVPLSGAEPGVLGTKGVPINQFSLETNDGQFRALVRWPEARCEEQEDAPDGADPSPPLTYFSLPLSRFGSEVEDAPERAFTAMPSPGAYRIENRFTEDFLVYGGRRSWGSYPPDADEVSTPASRVVAVPVRQPGRPSLLQVPHNVIRLERAGDDVVLTGYRDGSGLDISMVRLGRAPQVASTTRLPGRFESEGRSHAFNSRIDPGAGGMMGLPTVRGEEGTGRYPWNSDSSDVSFLTADAGGKLEAVGELLARENLPREAREAEEPAYECEVSCIDWYGNTRPIFTDGRVFGLAGTELVEGRIENKRVREVRRLDLRSKPGAR